MHYVTLACSLSDRVLTITLNRPERLNAFTVQMAEDLIAAFNRASDDDAVGAIIVTGAGRAFCAGMDLGREGNVFGLNEALHPSLDELHERLDDPEIVAGVRDTGGRVTLAIFDCKKPVIAAINGAAVGVGATMTLAMDIRLASDAARFGFVFGKIGIVPEACSTWFLPRIVGITKALEWTYSAEIFKADEAARHRLVSEVLAPEQLLPRAQAIAQVIANQRSPVSVALTRQMMFRNAALEHPREAHKLESLAMFYASAGDGKEGVAAFLEKREPVFTSPASAMPDFYPWW